MRPPLVCYQVEKWMLNGFCMLIKLLIIFIDDHEISEILYKMKTAMVLLQVEPILFHG